MIFNLMSNMKMNSIFNINFYFFSRPIFFLPQCPPPQLPLFCGSSKCACTHYPGTYLSTIIETSEEHSTMFKVTLLVDSPFNSSLYYEDFSHREGEIGSGSHFLFKFSIFFRDLGIRYSVDLGSQNCSVVYTKL